MAFIIQINGFSMNQKQLLRMIITKPHGILPYIKSYLTRQNGRCTCKVEADSDAMFFVDVINLNVIKWFYYKESFSSGFECYQFGEYG